MAADKSPRTPVGALALWRCAQHFLLVYAPDNAGTRRTESPFAMIARSVAATAV